MTMKDMLGRSGVVFREDALRILRERYVQPPLGTETISIDDALGRILAEGIVASADLPEFDRSTMDGYAVLSGDTFGASDSLPALLTVVGDIPMGTMPNRVVGRGETMKIATGGALPEGADAVVMFEQTQIVDEATIEVMKPVGPCENVIQRGDDIRNGEAILSAGHRIRPQDMAALASLGIVELPVFQRPVVAILSTGNELAPADTAPPPGMIRDSNSSNLSGLVLQSGGVPRRMGIIPDDYARLRATLEAALEQAALVLMTGGSSVGLADMTAKVINDLGSPGVLVHGVAIKPGKPLVVGLIRANGRDVPVFGLPGHPAAVSICYELFVKPLLTALTGYRADPALDGREPTMTVSARLLRGIASHPGREEHVRVALERRADGLWARPIFGASGLISTLVKAAGTVVVEPNSIGIEAGEEVVVRLF